MIGGFIEIDRRIKVASEEVPSIIEVWNWQAAGAKGM